jgi:all-trans-retinol 13,14-reductase
VLEQHEVIGGLTHTFTRNGFKWDVGVHYLGEMGPHEQFGRLIRWLADDRIQFASTGPTYDTFHFPGNFNIAFECPAEVLTTTLKRAFSDSAADIDRFFIAVHAATGALKRVFLQHALPRPVARLHAWWTRRGFIEWVQRTTEEVLEATIRDPKLRAVLSAQWPDYGGMPREGSFAIHALVMNDYLRGAYFPVGGARAFADALVPVIQRAGGAVHARAPVTEILLREDRAVGVRLEDGTEHFAKHVVSDAGARATVGQLLPASAREAVWAQDILSLKSSSAQHVVLYIGLHGDIAAAGAARCNHWFYDTWDTNEAIWRDPAATASAPALFISFPSLKDPEHNPGSEGKHTAVAIALSTWDAFKEWGESRPRQRPEAYRIFKRALAEKLLNQFKRHFPALASMIVYHEISTPLSTAHFVRRAQGESYGVETTPRRFACQGLRMKTPVPGLYLAGQDVVTPGLVGAMQGGMLAAAAIDPRVLRHV